MGGNGGQGNGGSVGCDDGRDEYPPSGSIGEIAIVPEHICSSFGLVKEDERRKGGGAVTNDALLGLVYKPARIGSQGQIGSRFDIHTKVFPSDVKFVAAISP